MMNTKKIVERMKVEGLSIEANAAKYLLEWLLKQTNIGPAHALEQVVLRLPKESRTISSRPLPGHSVPLSP